MDIQLLVNMLDVRFHGVVRQHIAFGDKFAVAPLGQQRKDLHFPLGQSPFLAERMTAMLQIVADARNLRFVDNFHVVDNA